MNKKLLHRMAGDFYRVDGRRLSDPRAFFSKPDYRQLAKLYRPEAEHGAYFPWMLLAHVLSAGAFTWIYARGKEARPWLAQGARFGLAVALLAQVPGYLIYYVVQPLPESLVVKQVVFSTILMIVLGIIVAWFYRERTTA